MRLRKQIPVAAIGSIRSCESKLPADRGAKPFNRNANGVRAVARRCEAAIPFNRNANGVRAWPSGASAKVFNRNANGVRAVAERCEAVEIPIACENQTELPEWKEALR